MLTPVPLALMTDGPALVEVIVTLALPVASVVTGVVGESVPRVAANVTGWPATGTPLLSQVTVTVLRGAQSHLGAVRGRGDVEVLGADHHGQGLRQSERRGGDGVGAARVAVGA